MAGIELKGLTVLYGEAAAVKRVNLTVADGQYCCLLGPSGCGKTSLLRAVAGFVPVAAGDILIDGQRVNAQYPGDRNLAMIFQNFALYPHLTVRGNFEFPLRAARRPSAEIAAQVKRVAAALHMEGLLDRYPRELSGGQQQRVAIGRAIMRTPRVFLLDEPLGNLDAKLKVSMRAHLRQLHDELKTTFIHVTHDQTEALALADMIVVMNEGSVEQVGSPAELYDHPTTAFVAGFIGAPPMNLIEGRLQEEAQGVAFKAAGLELDLIDHPKASVLRRSLNRRVLAGFRPEQALVGTASSGGIRARLALVEFGGEQCVLDLLVGPHPVKVRVARASFSGPLPVGTDVGLVLPKDQLVFFDAGTGGSPLNAGGPGGEKKRLGVELRVRAVAKRLGTGALAAAQRHLLLLGQRKHHGRKPRLGVRPITERLILGPAAPAPGILPRLQLKDKRGFLRDQRLLTGRRNGVIHARSL